MSTDKATDRICGRYCFRRLRHIILYIELITSTVESLWLLLDVDIESVLVHAAFQYLTWLLSLHGLCLAQREHASLNLSASARPTEVKVSLCTSEEEL